MLPTFAIIGAQKSASTFLQTQLQSHPDIFLPDGELALFEDPQYAKYDPNGLASHFEAGDNAEELGLKRPSYLHEPEVPERLFTHLPDIKLIVILRDPVERAVSAYFHQVRQNFAPLVEVNRGLANILEDRWADLYPRTSQVIEYGMYYRQIERYLNYFDKKNLYITTYKKISNKTKNTIDKVCKFLDIERKIQKIKYKKCNAGKYSKVRLKVARLVNQMRFDYFHEGKRLRPKERIGFLEGVIFRVLKSFNQHVLTLLETGKPSLNSDVHNRLVEHYRGDAEKLRSNFELDIDHWSVFSKEK
jgi:hypothetical protein